MTHEVSAPLEAESNADETLPSGGPGGCAGEVDADELPGLDARAIPHGIRHAVIFGALGGIAPGEGRVA